MSAAADLVAQLAVAGTPPELLAAVAEQLFAGQAAQAVIDTRKAKDRQRKSVSEEIHGNPRNSEDGAEIHDKGSLEVSPLASPLPKPSKQSPLSPPKSKEVEVPDWMPPAEWEAFKEMRRKMRGVPFTQSAERTVIAKLATLKSEGHDPAKLLSKAVERGHRTVFEDDTTRAAKNGKVERSAQEWRENAEWYVRHGQPDRAEDCRRRAIAIEQRVMQ